MKMIDPKDRRRFGLIVVLMLVGSLLEAVGIGLVLPYLQVVLDPNKVLAQEWVGPLLEWLQITGSRELLVMSSIGLIVLFIGKNFYLALMWRKTYKFYHTQYFQLAGRLFEGYMLAPHTFHLDRNTAENIRNVTSEANSVFPGAVGSAVNLLKEVTVIVGLIVVLVYAHTVAAGVAFLVMALAGWGLTSFFKKRLKKIGKRRAEHQSRIIQAVNEGLRGLKEAKVLGREREFLRAFSDNVKTVSDANRDAAMIGQYPPLLLETGAVVGMVSLAAVLVFTGPGLEDAIPVLGVFGIAAVRLIPSVGSVVGNVNDLRYNRASIDIVYEELETIERWRDQVAGTDGESGPTLHFDDRLEFDSVSFRYPEADELALKDVDIEINQGEHVGIVGSSGAGKTTTVNLVLGLLKPTKGAIRADGLNIHSNIRSWQRRIGYIPQEIYLTDDTIRRNVAFGLPPSKIDDERVWEVLEAAQIANFVAGLERGIDTVVGEEGVRLSGGQRQRVAIARALYRNPELLVLDEATSSLDYETERDVMSAVTELAGRKTLLTVTHRLNSVENCDRIIVLRHGSVVGEGSYSRLESDNLAFRRMVQAQS